jgi:quercetin dioxygenase-like cupin family protein
MMDILRVDEAKAGTPPGPDNFTGPVRMQRLSDEAGSQDFEIYAVFFDAGSRTRPHTHPGEQILVFVRGSGFVHLEGEEQQLVDEGGIVVVPAGVVHMHGALDDGPLCHIATRSANGPTNWSPPVPDEWQRYAKAQ